MCGICGILNLDGASVRKDTLVRMTDTMVHRGPDDAGVWHSSYVGLGSRRLSIIDLSPAGHQPMVSGCESFVLVYNGEVYNYRQLRDELCRLGYTFRSQSDTEVVLNAYCAWGQEAIPRFDGIFALAVWDTRAKNLVIARDRMGIKPLYYALHRNQFAFASEIKALMAWCPGLKDLNDDVLEEYLVFRDVAGEQTLVKEVFRLLPGYRMMIKNRSLEKKPYWVLPIRKSNADKGDDESPKSLEPLLRRTVVSQMVSDVPIGTLCSGGVDSSLVTAFAAAESSNSLHTFSVAFPGQSCDESEYSMQVAQQLKTKHHTLNADGDAFTGDLLKLTHFHDEPLNHENSVFVYQICKLARDNGVIVLLTGEGADELFAGYPQVSFADRLSHYRHWHVLPTHRLAMRLGGLKSPRKTHRWLYALSADEDALVLYATAYMAPAQAEKLMKRKLVLDFPYRQSMLERTKGLLLPERVRWMDLAVYLAPILMRQDKMSMATSVESRVPMLGNAVVEWSCAQPFKGLFAAGTGKVPLRGIARCMFSNAIIDRPKVGFATPFCSWLHSSAKLAALVRILDDPSSKVSDFMDRKVVKTVLDRHYRGLQDYSQVIWILLALEIWMREVLHG